MTKPKLDEDLVRRLSAMAERLDGGDEINDSVLLKEINELAGTEIPFDEFQGIYRAEEYEDYVRRVLTDQQSGACPDLDRAGLIVMFERILTNPSDDGYLQYVFSTIKKTFGDDQISDLVFWPGEYFGDGNDQRELTPELMADAVLIRYQQRTSR